MRRQERHGRAAGERRVRVRQGEAHDLRRQRRDHHAAERVAERPPVRLVLKQADGVQDVVRGDRRAIVPGRVGPDREGPDPSARIDLERRCEVGDDRAAAIEASESAEDEARHVLVHVGRGEDRIERQRRAGDALDVRAAERGIRRQVGPVGGDRDDARDREDPDQREDDELVATGHRSAHARGPLRRRATSSAPRRAR